MNPGLLKKIDACLGRWLIRCLPSAGEAVEPDIGRCLVLRPGGIGDAVLLVPVLRALKLRYPQASITVLAERRNAQVFELCPVVDRVLCYDVPRELAKAVLGRYQVTIDSEQWHRLSAVVCRLVNAPLSIGFATNERARLFSCRIGYSHDDYELHSFRKLFAPLGLPADAAIPVPFLKVPESAALRADVLLAPLTGKRLVAMFPGASVAERRWGGERFLQVAHALAQAGYAVVAVGGPGDVQDAHTIVGGTGGLSVAGETSLAETAAVIARCALLVSADSGLLHIAVGLGVPTVSLFGPGIEAKWGPKGEGDAVVNRRLACSPCTSFGSTPPCPFGVRCMAEITPEEVAAAALQLLERLL